MKREQYQKRLEQLSADFNNARYALQREYALSNNPYKEGDIFTDHIGSIKIIDFRVEVSYSSNTPAVSYRGFILNKDGSVTKRKDNTRRAYLRNDINQKL